MKIKIKKNYGHRDNQTEISKMKWLFEYWKKKHLCDINRNGFVINGNKWYDEHWRYN